MLLDARGLCATHFSHSLSGDPDDLKFYIAAVREP